MEGKEKFMFEERLPVRIRLSAVLAQAGTQTGSDEFKFSPK